MKIYVIETSGDYTTQIGFSTSRKVAEQKAKELIEYFHSHGWKNNTAWVTEYSEGKNLYCEFNNE